MPSRRFSLISLTLLLLFGIGFFTFSGNNLTKLKKTDKPVVVEVKQIKAEQKEVKIIFVGDIMLDRYIRKMMAIYGEDQPFSCLDSLLQSADLVVGNLEGPITNNKSISFGSIIDSPENFVFTFATSTADLLFKHNIRLVNLGNNHVNNFGADGIKQTKLYLEQAGVNYFGGMAGDNPIFKTSIDKTNLSFINYNQFGGDSVEKIVELIKQEKNQDNLVIVYTHWGEEYIPATEKIKVIAKTFSEAGVDLIIGSHPHVIQKSEVIGKTIVYYSLGNFIFDQYFTLAVRTGLVLIVTFRNNEFKIEEQKITLNRNGQTCLLN